MANEPLQTMVEWVGAHPHWASVALFLISLIESLAVVGALLPGVVILFGIGTLIGAGVLDFWSMVAWAVGGAVVGDGVSFWLGRHHRERLRRAWPFCRYPRMLEQGEAFFRRYGGKSIAFGRFVGPVRAIIPLVAGMMGMRPGRFVAANVGSALVWAPAYLLPGVLFGASLELAAEVASRLVIALLLLLATGWLVVWLIHRLFNLLQPRAPLMIHWVVGLGRAHPRRAGSSRGHRAVRPSPSRATPFPAGTPSRPPYCLAFWR